MSRILVVEDEQHLADGLRFNLEAESYDAEVVDTGEAALDRIFGDGEPVDLVVLDVMLPGMSGFEVVHRLRESGTYLPVLMLTARGHADDVVRGFEAGADDYLAKPFELSVLIARVGGLLRRNTWATRRARAEAEPPAAQGPDQFSFAGRELDFSALAIRRGDRVLPLTLMEANLLRYLVQHEGQVVSRKQILDQVWGVHEDTDTRAIDNFIVRLRRYLEDDPSKPRYLLTVRSVGYRFVADPS
jgi:DNA-binding response OmpR family regulator